MRILKFRNCESPCFSPKIIPICSLALCNLVSRHIFYRQLGLKYSVLCPPEVNILPVQDNVNAWIRKHERQFYPQDPSSIPIFLHSVTPNFFFISSSFLFTDISSSYSHLKVTEKPSLFPLYPSLSLPLQGKHFFFLNLVHIL